MQVAACLSVPKNTSSGVLLVIDCCDHNHMMQPPRISRWFRVSRGATMFTVSLPLHWVLTNTENVILLLLPCFLYWSLALAVQSFRELWNTKAMQSFPLPALALATSAFLNFWCCSKYCTKHWHLASEQCLKTVFWLATYCNSALRLSTARLTTANDFMSRTITLADSATSSTASAKTICRVKTHHYLINLLLLTIMCQILVLDMVVLKSKNLVAADSFISEPVNWVWISLCPYVVFTTSPYLQTLSHSTWFL